MDYNALRKKKGREETDEKEFKNLGKKLRNAEQQILFLEQAKTQLTAFAGYALKKGKPELAEIYKKNLGYIEEALKQKEHLRPEFGIQDSVHNQMDEMIRTFFRP